MIRHFLARKEGFRHWAFKLKECKAFCTVRDNGGTIPEIYTRPLYF